MQRREFLKTAFCALGFLMIPRISFGREDKEIYLWLDAQVGAAYENGKIVGYPDGFRIISGYDGLAALEEGGEYKHYKPTPKETHWIIDKIVKGYSKKYKAHMPYALQFGKEYFIHAWSWDEPLPPPGHRYASHGCVSVDLPVAAWLFDWTPIGTPVYIWGERKNA